MVLLIQCLVICKFEIFALLSGRRKLHHTLSLGLSEDPESESLPFLPLEWDQTFPVTPAQENGHSLDNNNFMKGKSDSLEDKDDDDLAGESCNGQSDVQPGCSALWAIKSASEFSCHLN